MVGGGARTTSLSGIPTGLYRIISNLTQRSKPASIKSKDYRVMGH